MLLVYALTGFAVSLLTVPLITSFALKAHIVDVPGDRKIHIDNTPLLGGLGIFVSYFVILLLLDSFSYKTYALLGANIIIVMTGILDDIVNLRASRKLIAQIIASSVIIFMTDFRFAFTTFEIDIFSNPLVNIPITYLWIVGVTNAINLIDGMDGLAGGISFMAFGAMGYAAYMKGFEFNAYVCIGLMGATLGFLRYNIPPAKVFMGDTGSLFLGFNIAVMSIATSHKSATILSVVIPVMFISLPLFDTVLAIVRRTLKGQNPMSADKEHLHHRLLNLEFSSVQTLMIFYSLSIALIAISLISFEAHFIWGAIIVLLLLYGFLISLKLSHKYDIASRIRHLNERIRDKGVRISKYNMERQTNTLYLDIVIGITTFIMMFKFIWIDAICNFTFLSSSIIFIISQILIMAYKQLSKIKNQFVSFGFFWIFFYLVLQTSKTGFGSFEYACLSILGVCSLLKALKWKQLDLFISSPVELLMFFCMMLIFMFSKIDFFDYFIICMFSLVIYYSNKFFFLNKTLSGNIYPISMVAMLIVFTISTSINFMMMDMDGENMIVTPGKLNNIVKQHNKAQDYSKARDAIIAYNIKNPPGIMRSSYKNESSKTYFNLIIEALFAGDVNLSDKYLNEFLVMFPDMAQDFYESIEPIVKRVPDLNIEGAGNITLHGTPISEIVSVYSNTLNSYADRYYIAGYEKKAESYRAVAKLFENLTR